MIQSAEEYLRINFELEITKDRIGYVQSSDAYKAMIEFARLHVQAALDAADAEVPLPYSHGVLNAYPPENIT